jgi:type IV pilus assembly protein PilV
MPQRPTDESGFTLLESLLASVFLSVSLLALSAMQGVSLARNVDASELTRVTNLASDIIERIQFNRKNVNDYIGLDTKAGTPCPATMGLMARGDCLQWKAMLEEPAARLDTAKGTVSVTAEGPISPALNQRRVTVTVSWNGSNSGSTVKRSRSITLETVIAPE